MARCKYCSSEITWMKEGRKNIPVEFDGATHRCDAMLDAINSLKNMEPTSLTPEEIKKYEEAMNQKAKK